MDGTCAPHSVHYSNSVLDTKLNVELAKVRVQPCILNWLGQAHVRPSPTKVLLAGGCPGVGGAPSIPTA